MAKVTKKRLTIPRLKDLLTQRLKLKDPVFRLEKYDNRIGGSIISSTFKGKRDHARLDMIWDVLEEEFDRSERGRLGWLLVYTPDEWNLGLGPNETPIRKVKKAG